MKTFQLKQELWSLGGRFNISDETGAPHYQCEGSLFRVPKQFTITDMQGKLVSQIEKKFLSFLPTFKVNLACGESFTLRKEWTFFKPRYQIENLKMTIQGDFWDMDFELERDGQVLARISQLFDISLNNLLLEGSNMVENIKKNSEIKESKIYLACSSIKICQNTQ